MNDKCIGLATIKAEGKSHSFDNPEIEPWVGYVDEFNKFFNEEYGQMRIPSAVKNRLKKAMRKSWDMALMVNARENKS